jgi:hypothetical protein
MAMRVVFFLVCSALLAKDTLPTMATHKVLSAKEFGAKRAKGKGSKPKEKKWKKDRKGKKAQWGAAKKGAVTVRPKS